MINLTAVQKALNAPIEEWAVCGGAALELHGVRSNADHDWDVLASSALIERLRLQASEFFERQTSSTHHCLAIEIGEHVLDVLDVADNEEWQGYLKRAEFSNGVRVVTLADLYDWKVNIQNGIDVDKHQADAALIESFLADEKEEEELL